VLGTAISSWIGAVVWWWQLRAAVRQHNAQNGDPSPRHRLPGGHRKMIDAQPPDASGPLQILRVDGSGSADSSRTV
jgi:hypothetical protein